MARGDERGGEADGIVETGGGHRHTVRNDADKDFMKRKNSMQHEDVGNIEGMEYESQVHSGLVASRKILGNFVNRLR